MVDQFKVGNYYGYCDVGYLVNCCFTVYARASKFASTDQEISLELLTPSMVILLSASKVSSMIFDGCNVCLYICI